MVTFVVHCKWGYEPAKSSCLAIAVVIARLLNSSLVYFPRFSTAASGEIHILSGRSDFINYLTPDIRIRGTGNSPKELQSQDLDAIGSTVTDVDVPKESEPSFYLKSILPILLKNRVVHFVGFGNRLAFDPIPFQLQVNIRDFDADVIFLHCNLFPRYKKLAPCLLQRLRKHGTHPGSLDRYLTGPFAEPSLKGKAGRAVKASRYLAIHLRFEIDMLAHSLCEYGGGEEERKELEAYREIHFPALTHLKKTTDGHGTTASTLDDPFIVACIIPKLNLYLNTEHLNAAVLFVWNWALRATHFIPERVGLKTFFQSIPIRLAALDFIACTAADAFAMTDSGSQLSSLVSGFRIYYGGGKMPTIRPNKRRLADIFMKNNTIRMEDIRAES
ncbi:O-fucosyltransferase 15-like [Populus alba x Populus x berolinensis]|nr:O-fucosyltransferase 15-like [Populus alba x Populus x berolinensis]